MTGHTPLLELRQLTRTFSLPREHLLQPAPVVHALRGVSLSVQAGQSLGIVGESGCGKSTLARLVMALDTPSSGQVLFEGQNLHELSSGALKAARRQFQMVFQDPYGSLDPRMTVADTVSEPLLALANMAGRAHAAKRLESCAQMLQAVGLGEADLQRYPHEFSGGQRQRIAIARALITQPKLIVADEPVSALDVSVQAQVLNLLQSLQQDLGITFILISHDLAVVRHLCAHVAVMRSGKIEELGPTDQVFEQPRAPYTRELLAAAA